MSSQEEKSTKSYTGMLKKCRSFFSTMRMNDSIRPNVIIGIKAVYNGYIRLFSEDSLSRIFYTNELKISSFYPSGYRFGVFYIKKNYAQEQPNNADDVDASPAIVVSVSTDIRGNFAGQAQWQIADSVRAVLKGQWSVYHGQTDAFVEWARDCVNVRLTGRADSHNRWATFSLDSVVRLRQWSIGNQVLFQGNEELLGCSLHKAFCMTGFTNVLRYDGNRTAFTAVVDNELDVSLLYQRRVNDRLTVGVELAVIIPTCTTKAALIHRLELRDGMVLKGQLDTDGNVISQLSIKYQPNITVGVSTLLNHKSDFTGVGLEFKFGEKSSLN